MQISFANTKNKRFKRKFREFGNYFKASRSHKNSNIPYGYHERKNVFCPGGLLARRMAVYRYAILQIGSWLFVHGGIHPDVSSKYSIHQINDIIMNWLLNKNTEENKSALEFLYHNEDDSVSPFWTRIYSDLDNFSSNEKDMFYKTLNNINMKNKEEQQTEAKGMIIGHSPQFMYKKGINSALNRTCWRVDVGVSRAFGKHIATDKICEYRKVQVLEIIDDGKIINVLS